MPILVYAPQAISLNKCAHYANKRRRDQKPHPKAQVNADLIGEIGTKHIKARMRKVQNAHHRKDKGQTCREHEQQQARDKAIDQIDKDKIHSGLVHWE